MFEILIYILKGIFGLLIWTWWIIVPIIGILALQNFRKKKWVESLEAVVLSVKIPKNSEKGPQAAEMMFASLHSILKPDKELKKEGSIQEHISFEIVADADSINFYVWTPKHLQNFVEGQIYAQYPTAEIAVSDDYSKNIDIDSDGADDYVAGCELNLVKPDYFPIKTFVNFEVDPLAGITGALSKIEDKNEKMWVQIITRPVSDSWRNKGLAYADSLKGTGKPKLLSSDGIWHIIFSTPKFIISSLIEIMIPGDKSPAKTEKKISKNMETALACLEEKANKLGFQVKIRLLYVAKSKELARQHLRITSGAFKQFNTTVANGFTPTKIRTDGEVLDEYKARLFTNKGYVLNIEEIASLYHLPHTSVETPNIVWTSSKKGEPPANLPYADLQKEGDQLTVFAETTFRGKLRPFGIKEDDRRRHVYVIGKSGAGKSKLLELMSVADIKNGSGVGIVDPHGELIHDVLKHIPSHRIKDVVYINPADREHPIGFNILKTTPEFREETASGFVSVFHKLFDFSWGPRLEYVLRYTILALTYYPNATMLDVIRMLTDKNYRKKVLDHVEDPVVKTFWLKEWQTYNDRFQSEAVSPILNKVGQFTASPIIRNIVGQTDETFDFEDAMNSEKIILVDLSTGKIGEDNSKLLGSMMITRMQLAAMARAKIAPEDRKDFYLYVDEFQNFATESFGRILSEARKYRLSLTLANQYIAQMDENVRDAVFGNVGTLISFRVGATDAAFLEKEFSPVFEKDDLINLDNQHIYLNMLIDGITSNSFSAKVLNVSPGTENNVDKIVAASRERYTTDKSIIEEKIRKWSNVDNLTMDDDTPDHNKQSAHRDRDHRHEKKDTDKKYNSSYKGKGETQPFPPNHKKEPYKPVEKQPIKKSIDPEELKKIIEKVTKPSAPADREEAPVVVSSEKSASPVFENKKEEVAREIKPGETIYFDKK